MKKYLAWDMWGGVFNPSLGVAALQSRYFFLTPSLISFFFFLLSREKKKLEKISHPFLSINFHERKVKNHIFKKISCLTWRSMLCCWWSRSPDTRTRPPPDLSFQRLQQTPVKTSSHRKLLQSIIGFNFQNILDVASTIIYWTVLKGRRGARSKFSRLKGLFT